ncbi:MAG: 5'/3'-nucleotidase SurE [Puniceicoccales bacterium]|jgi:5'-nucleotidase|nr:5'/3'-nucleotidase SurE [Puniceicoccales bacterium]
MKRPHVLITNDDGIDSHFLLMLVEAHLESFRVSIVAPLGEQSWIGRAFSRHRDVRVTRMDNKRHPAPAWAVDGTPSDCVNIALGHLLAGDRPDVVVSGINIGFNVSMPLSLSSGTLAGAIEGAAWGLPSLAYSLDLADETYEEARRNQGKVSGEAGASLHAAARRAVRFTAEQAGMVPEPLHVHNVNFPRHCTADTPVEQTVPADVRLGCVYKRETPASFRFQWVRRETKFPSGDNTDVACLLRGHISHGVLDYGRLGGVSMCRE